MAKFRILLFISFPAMIFSCSERSARNQSVSTQSNAPVSTYEQTDTTYLHTGYYFLSGLPTGVRKEKEKSGEIYHLEALPFASVQNIIKTRLEKSKTEQGVYTELCMTFDSTGRKNLEDATGNVEHPQIAVVVDNKLLYVVDNNTKVTTGLICVILIGYTENEMLLMKQAVDEKK